MTGTSQQPNGGDQVGTTHGEGTRQEPHGGNQAGTTWRGTRREPDAGNQAATLRALRTRQETHDCDIFTVRVVAMNNEAQEGTIEVFVCICSTSRSL